MNALALMLDDQLAFWKQALAGAPTKLELPTDKIRPAAQSLVRAREAFALPAAIYGKLKGAAAADNATPFMMLAAGFLALANRHTGQDDILLGAPFAAPGAAVRIAVLRAQFSDGLTFRALLRQVRDRTLAAELHADLPFEQLCAALVPARDASHAPLCQVMVAYEAAESSEGRGARPVAFRAAVEQATARCDLTLFAA